jgi:hypothetical protein
MPQNLSLYSRFKLSASYVKFILKRIRTVCLSSIAQHKVKFSIFIISFLVVYVSLVVLVCYFQVGFWPTRFRGFDYWAGVWESVTLPVPILERYDYVAFQPLLEAEAVDPKAKSIHSGEPISIWRFTVRTATLFRTAMNAFLISLFLVTFIDFLRIGKGVSHSGIKGAIGYVALTLTILGAVMGLGASLGASCCGGVSVSIIFYLMGMSTEQSLEIAKWADPMSNVGVIVLNLSIIYQSLSIGKMRQDNC